MKLTKLRLHIAYRLYKLSRFIYPDGIVPPALHEPEPPMYEPETKPEKGRVVKVTAPPVYDPEVKRKGGRMVKRMPRQLQKIKQGQETPRDE